jgi:hypothetical protein
VSGAASAAVLLLSLGLLCARRIDTATQLCTLQALFAAVTLGEAATAIAVLAFSLNGVVLPLAIARMTGATMLTLRGNAILSWAATLALLVVTGLIFVKIGADGLVSAGVSVSLLGPLLIVLRSHALAPALGLLSSQNGLVLVAGAIPDVSLQAAFAVAVPLVPALVLAESWLRRCSA